MKEESARCRCTPTLLQLRIHKECGIKFHITYVRKLMRKYGPTPKVPQLIHINHATKDAVRSWQYRLRDHTSHLKSDGFTIVAADEAFFTYDPKSGRKYWSPVNERILFPYCIPQKELQYM